MYINHQFIDTLQEIVLVSQQLTKDALPFLQGMRNAAVKSQKFIKKLNESITPFLEIAKPLILNLAAYHQSLEQSNVMSQLCRSEKVQNISCHIYVRVKVEIDES